jgi:N-acetylgalactosamine-N,N'-diacetylbacillosaminyl-diphospho-undecaprenol 4-alpha-N-acetylgalactosaminyltransferase
VSLKKVTLFINSLTSGGAERVLSVIVTELVAQNIEVNLLCIEKDNAYVLPKEVNITYLSDLTKHDSSLKKLLYLPYLAFKLKRHIQTNQTTLVQSHIYRANFTNILAKIFGAKHQVQVVEVTSINNLKDGSFSKKINFLLIKLLYKHADLVIFKAQRMKEEFLKNIPKIKKHTVINNPYDIKKITSLSEEPVEDFEFSKDKQYIVSVGRLSSEKRFSTLIKVLKDLAENIELILIGEGEEAVALKEYALANNLENRVHLLGKKNNPFKYIKQAKLFVLASEGEGFPNVIVEAMICSIPVISTDCISGPREILAPHTDINFQLKSNIELTKNGILYPVDDENSLTLAIKTMLSDNVKQKEYIANGLEQSQQYALKKIIEKYKEVLCVV